MIRLIIFLFPILACMIDSGLTFIAGYRLSESGAEPIAIVARMAVRAIVYCLVSWWMTRVITPRRSPWLIVAAASILLVISLLACLPDDVRFHYLWCALSGAAVALYSTSFQVFMKRLENGAKSGIIHSTALYTFAWSFGSAVGPFFFGKLTDVVTHRINACASLFIIIVVILINALYPERPAISVNADLPDTPDKTVQSSSNRRNLVLMGWISGGFITFLLSIVITLEPALLVHLGMSKFHAGAIIAVMFTSQALGGFLLIVSKNWMYRTKPLLELACFGIASFALFSLCKSVFFLYLAAVCFGVMSSGCYFLFVYHSLIHPTRSSRYVALNETIVGIMGTLSILVSGALSQYVSIRSAFAVGVLLTLLMLALQLLAMRFNPIKD